MDNKYVTDKELEERLSEITLSPTEKKLYSMREVRRITGLSRNEIIKLIEEGHLTPLTILKKRWHFAANQVNALADLHLKKPLG